MYTIELDNKIIPRQKFSELINYRDHPNFFIYLVSPKSQKVTKCTFHQFCELSSIKKFNNLESLSEESTMDKLQFLTTAASIIKPFNGNPDELDSFIRNVQLIQHCTEGELKPFFLDFIKGRITGHAGSICSSARTIDELISRLREVIRKESSKEVASKLDALNSRDIYRFFDDADNLGAKFFDSLVSEGCPAFLANTMAIDKMTIICRRAARSDLIKSVIAASSYSSFRDVLTTFRSEIALRNLENRQNFNSRGPYQQQRTDAPRRSQNSNNYHQRNHQPPQHQRQGNNNIRVLNDDSENFETTRRSEMDEVTHQ